jgi:hypothetical protein
LRSCDNRSRPVDQAKTIVYRDRCATLMEVMCLTKLSRNSELARFSDVAPFTANLNGR